MNSYPIPRLFVSRRNDRRPSGFNCVNSQKDVFFLSRGPRGIWRRFKCKGHYLKDRHYRFDQEKVIYPEKLDAIPVSDVSAQIRAEIEKTRLRADWLIRRLARWTSFEGRGGSTVFCAYHDPSWLFFLAVEKWWFPSSIAPPVGSIESYAARGKCLCVSYVKQNRDFGGACADSVSSGVATCKIMDNG